ncbi:MAG: hypothetical protein J7L86_07550 [Candidatus Marinimicrobia bacterium]|nr:hypothetical protein [Candidatus Neomarinimicrobiota bacterium]
MGKLDIRQDKWKLLANAIEEKLHNQSGLFNSDPDIEKIAQPGGKSKERRNGGISRRFHSVGVFFCYFFRQGKK